MSKRKFLLNARVILVLHRGRGHSLRTALDGYSSVIRVFYSGGYSSVISGGCSSVIRVSAVERPAALIAPRPLGSLRQPGSVVTHPGEVEYRVGGRVYRHKNHLTEHPRVVEHEVGRVERF